MRVINGRFRIPALVCSISAAAGCGERMDDDARDAAFAQQASEVAGSAILALSLASDVGVESAAAQDESDEPEPPPTAQDACVTLNLGLDLSLLVDYGDGCLIGPTFIAGAFVLRLQQQRLGLEIEFQRFEVDAVRFDGTISVGVGQGRINAAMALQVTRARVQHQLDFTGSLWGQPGFLLMDGAGAYDMGSGRWAFDATDLRLSVGDCYPDEGVMVLETPFEDQPVAFFFTSDTPRTGTVQVRVDQRALFPVALPPYGACPSPALP